MRVNPALRARGETDECAVPVGDQYSYSFGSGVIHVLEDQLGDLLEVCAPTGLRWANLEHLRFRANHRFQNANATDFNLDLIARLERPDAFGRAGDDDIA